MVGLKQNHKTICCDVLVFFVYSTASFEIFSNSVSVRLKRSQAKNYEK